MDKVEPDFSTFSRDDLYYVLDRIDHNKYPERVARIKEALIGLKANPRANNSEQKAKITGVEKIFLWIVIEILFACLIIFFT